MKTVYFDESGHTGYKYLHPDQRVLGYGGLLISEDEAFDLKNRYFAEVQAHELKHSNLQGTNIGRGAILHLMRDERAWIAERFKWFQIDKPYALLSKYVDLLIENATHDQGDNLYSSGMNAQLVAMIWLAARASKREEALLKLLTAFSNFSRTPTLDTLSALEAEAHRFSVGDEHIDFIVRMPFQRLGTRLLGIVAKEQLDLSMTGAWTLLDLWYRQIGEPFALVHDAGAQLKRQEEQWRAVTRLEAGYEVEKLGPFEMPINIPLLSTEFVSSAESVPLQLVDVILGAKRRHAQWLIEDRPEDAYCESLHEVIGDMQADWSIPPPMASLMALDQVDQSGEEADQVLGKFGSRLPPRQRYSPPNVTGPEANGC